MVRTLTYDEFVASGVAVPQAEMRLTMRTVVTAALSDAPRYGYEFVQLVVNLPPAPMPLARPRPLPGAGLDWGLATRENFDRFMATTDPLVAEQAAIIQACCHGWRAPTKAEQRRLDAIIRQFELASAAFERTIAPGTH